MPSDSLPDDNWLVTSFSQDGQLCSVFTPDSKIKTTGNQFSWPEIIQNLRAGEGLDQRPAQAGRGGIFYFSDSQMPQPLVVRQYRHGGLWRFFSRDRFFSQARFLTELRVHRRVVQLGVPVPEAVAVIILKKGSRSVFVRGYFVTVRIKNSLTLPEFLQTASGLTRLRIFFKLGGYLKKLHDYGIFYTDMHVKNILINEAGEPCLIDFDKAGESGASLSFHRRLANLKRFLRSLEKYRSRGGRLTESDRSAFLLAYAADSKVYADLFQKINRGRIRRMLLYRLGWLLNRS